ncbi:MAG TPA: hypothetical protein VNQ77_08000 [Frankiaceae bacterium]|nr:hypothetical protein [Frankiaceae bacterium]
MTSRKLTLRREQLAELTTDDLSDVVAGATTANTKECPDYTYYCITGYAMCRSTRLVCA